MTKNIGQTHFGNGVMEETDIYWFASLHEGKCVPILCCSYNRLCKIYNLSMALLLYSMTDYGEQKEVSFRYTHM